MSKRAGLGEGGRHSTGRYNSRLLGSGFEVVARSGRFASASARDPRARAMTPRWPAFRDGGNNRELNIMSIAPMATRPCRIVVSGDLVVDHHIYEGDRPAPTTGGDRGVRHIAEVGGAEGLWRLLKEIDVKARSDARQARLDRDAAMERAREKARLAGKSPRESTMEAAAVRETIPAIPTPVECDAVRGVEPPDLNVRHAGHHAFAIWQPHALDPAGSDKREVWRTGTKMGYGHSESVTSDSGTEFRPRRAEIDAACDVLVLDDAGYRFREKAHAECWHLPAPGSPPPWILLKLSEPIAHGDLWTALVPPDEHAPGHADRMVCLVSATDLRTEPVRVTCGFSWENALEGLSDALQKAVFSPLNRCRHLVVVFGGDAALWIDRKDPWASAHFCFAAADAEGDYAAGYEGEAVGHMTAMAAALAYGIAQTAPGADLNLGPWTEAGLRAMRDLLRLGHGIVTQAPDRQPNGYPVARLAGAILTPETTGLEHTILGWPREPHPDRPWTIVESMQRPHGSEELRGLTGLAAAVVRQGRVAYGASPHAQFGKFVTAERSEVEMLRGISGRMRAYKKANETKTDAKPLAIGVFGPPGAGKSFAVREIAEKVFGETAWKEFNLSQFNDIRDFNGALHQVRDEVLKGRTPVVFWDEFDSREFHWLRYLLAPLQDGRFQDGPVTHGVGRSVFVFAGGTSWRYADFGEPRDGVDSRELQLAKVPDFKSRLDAFYDVSGPNPRFLFDANGVAVKRDGQPVPDRDDLGFPLRRAFLIRGQLGLKPDDVLTIDADLLRALLLVPFYQHGARSLEKLLKSMPWTPRTPLSRSMLPPSAQLNMYVNANEFEKLMLNDLEFFERRKVPELAKVFHEAYINDARASGWTIQPQINKPFDDLNPEWKQDNVEAARRIPEVLSLVGLGIQEASRNPGSPGPDPDTLRDHLRRNLERLAAAEHDGWWRFRERNGWRYGPARDDSRRIHPLMVPYAKLQEPAKDRDRKTITDYAERLAGAGYRIVWLGDEIPEATGPLS